MAAADKKITYTAAEVAELIRPLSQSVEALQKENAELKRKLEHMNEVFANAQRAQYGQSSEKKTYVLNEDQLNFFNEAEDCQDHKAEEPTEETLTVKAHARKKKRTVDELAKNLPVEEIVIDLPESRLTCDKCGGTFKLIGKKLIRRELIIIPQSEKILEYYSCTYACDKCEKDTGFAHIITTKTPPPLMKHVDFENRECIVMGKGSKERPVYFDARTKIHLHNYIKSRTDDNPALFVSLLAPYNRLEISGVEIRLRNLGRKLDIPKVHPHKFRRTLATRAIDKGMPIEQLQQLLGHTKIDIVHDNCSILSVQ